MAPDTDREKNEPSRPEPQPPVGSGEVAGQPEKLRLLEEQVSFERERVETGRVRVRVVTRAHDEAFEVPLTRESVEVQRVPIGREVDAIPPRRQEGDTTIVPIVEEVVVVQRKLVLKEELHLKLVRVTEQHRETVTLRRQEALVERLPAEQHRQGETPT
jgi:uncharacterized protein (TIGR02271 family)